jgi:hypothetical protein
MAPGTEELLTKVFIVLILMGGWCRPELTPTRLKVRPRGKVKG